MHVLLERILEDPQWVIEDLVDVVYDGYIDRVDQDEIDEKVEDMAMELFMLAVAARPSYARVRVAGGRPNYAMKA